MNCCKQYESEQQKKVVTLTFKRKELLYDASNYSFVEADIMPQDTEHAKHQVFDIVQDGNIDRVTRILNLAHAECVELLYPYAKEELPDAEEVLNDILKEPDTYTIKLMLPYNFSMTTVKMLEEYIHEFLVCSVLSDWLSITFPQSAERWESKLRDTKIKIRTSLMSRMGKVRRKLKPW